MQFEIENSRPIWQQLAEQLTVRIVTGAYPAGSRFPTVRELAAEDRAVEIRCQLCGTAYSFPPAELLALAEEDGSSET